MLSQNIAEHESLKTVFKPLLISCRAYNPETTVKFFIEFEHQ